ncbi:uncharacterized protein K444DRAFT_606921 [Hyaloscypha bicolor E]|uniref:Uncharacterized protein n=1 Tax=Hyaloscypha bicolor E TaxID=1095630 RepID=A0A2J6TUD7_9HELO|nr:uncharacterized protein K444DRAFT_606921 [Hyaloscypha bicolor E]PMD66607.1 hypothetical protein K444DRAFT_606921 [Hyaloscypha bicolor E]
MPALDPRIIQGLAEASVIFQRGVPGHSIVEAFLVVFVSVFGVGGAIVWAIKKG